MTITAKEALTQTEAQQDRIVKDFLEGDFSLGVKQAISLGKRAVRLATNINPTISIKDHDIFVKHDHLPVWLIESHLQSLGYKTGHDYPIQYGHILVVTW